MMGKHTRRQRLSLLGAEDGMTLIELLIAAAVFVVAVLGLMSAMIVSTHMTDLNRQDSLALQAAQSAIERMVAETFSEVFQKYNAAPDNRFAINDRLLAPAGIITDPSGYRWNEKWVDSTGRNTGRWETQSGKPVFQGEIIFPNTDPNSPGLLTEFVPPPTEKDPQKRRLLQASMERLRLFAGAYLEINGEINGIVSQNAAIDPANVLQLPVIVYIEWRDPAGGKVATVLETILAKR